MDEEDQLEILQVLLFLSQTPTFPFRILVISRPEGTITNFFTINAVAAKIFLDFKYNPDADIARYLALKFAEIRRDKGISDPLWPGQSAVDQIVHMSSGQFIVPATIIGYIAGGPPKRRLKEVLSLELVEDEANNPFAALDALYYLILKRCYTPRHDPHLVVKWILCVARGLRTRAPSTPAQFWRHFLVDDEGELDHCMAPIASLVSIPPASDNSSPIVIYHVSLPNFLSSERRCGDLYVDQNGLNSFVADRIARVIQGLSIIYFSVSWTDRGFRQGANYPAFFAGCRSTCFPENFPLSQVDPKR